MPMISGNRIHVASIMFQRVAGGTPEQGIAFVEAPGVHSVDAIFDGDGVMLNAEPHNWELGFLEEIVVQSGTASFKVKKPV